MLLTKDEQKIKPKIFVDIHKTTSTTLSFRDYSAHFLLRLGFNRKNSIVETGIYAVGKPTKKSPVFVSANYTMSFNKLRSSLNGIDAWIMVIDTRGINVWCAAGKGTFGTAEIIRCINTFNLARMVDHREIIVPQLGASGTSSFEVKKATGFSVIFGPVKSEDIKNFIKAGYTATRTMRKIEFDLFDRIVLIPVEIMHTLKYIFIVSLVLAFASYNLMIGFLLSVVSGIILTPAFLFKIPFRAFILKGFLAGFIVETLYFTFYTDFTFLSSVASILLFSSVSGYFAFNFTGCTTFTSPSGVKKEIEKYMVPLIFIAIGGFVLLVIQFIRGLE